MPWLAHHLCSTTSTCSSFAVGLQAAAHEAAKRQNTAAAAAVVVNEMAVAKEKAEEEEQAATRRAKQEASSKAEAAKAKGNACFEDKQYDEAIRLYSEAIALDDAKHEFYSNRSNCMRCRRTGIYAATEHSALPELAAAGR